MGIAIQTNKHSEYSCCLHEESSFAKIFVCVHSEKSAVRQHFNHLYKSISVTTSGLRGTFEKYLAIATDGIFLPYCCIYNKFIDKLSENYSSFLKWSNKNDLHYDSCAQLKIIG